MPEEKDRQRAVQFAELNVRQNPNGIEQLSTYGWTSFRVGRRSDAERALSTALKSAMAAQNNMVGPEMGYYLAALAIDNGKAANATTWLKNALNTTGPFAYRKAAQIAVGQGRENRRAKCRQDRRDGNSCRRHGHAGRHSIECYALIRRTNAAQ